MVTPPEVLAIIPARGGSKGIPHKNIRDFAGHPLIAYSIAAGRQAQLVTRVMVSTDDEEIARISRLYGAEIPFLRPTDLAQDNTLDLPVFEHALRWLENEQGYHPDVVIQLRPTSPVRPKNCVDDAVRLLLGHPQADSVRGVVPAGQNPYKMWQIDPQSDFLKPLLDVDGISEPYNAPRQVLPSVYWQTGHIDAIRPDTILKKGSMSGGVILPLMIEPRYTVDIDTLSDWARAEWLVNRGELEMVFPGSNRRSLPEKVDLIVFDFDGVMTDNRVWVDQEGYEMVAAYRSDGIGLSRIRKLDIKMIVLSTESNPVVAMRCQKLNLPVFQAVKDKAAVLRSYLKDQGIDPTHAIYVGNDTNDIPCFSEVGCAFVVNDAHAEARMHADIILEKRGGHGAVRELCDMIYARQKGETIEGKVLSKGEN